MKPVIPSSDDETATGCLCEVIVLSASYTDKFITGMENLHYEERLRRLWLMTLETRKVRRDMIEVFKFINGCYTINANIFFGI